VDLQDQKARRKIGGKFETQTDFEGKVAGIFFKWLRQEAIVIY
jgi:phosphoribosylformimino-5-aminoimidazole carboxamide ribonucleotide (ProFAR) isomerase